MTEEKPLTYAGSGVDVARVEVAKRKINPLLKGTWNDRIVPNVSGFKAVYDDGTHYLIGATDGVGTKLLVAIMARRLSTVGRDLVAMCANDLGRVGAHPLFFLDYMATGKLDESQHYDIIAGIAKGCEIGGFPLMGGETAQMPGMYSENHFDLAGFVVGRVEKDKIIDGRKIRKGAVLLGIESSGLHSNGYSLARRVIFEKQKLGIDDRMDELGQTVADVLLEPTIIYTKPTLDLVAAFPGQIQGMAHITGGGMENKVPNALPPGLGAVVEVGSWPVHPIFSYIQKNGPVEIDEMRRTFNMGIGMVVMVNDSGVVPDLQSRLKETHNLRSYVIGKVAEGEGVAYSGRD
jgi:phosphoribosylformylglycinamidine cyclo-ligase